MSQKLKNLKERLRRAIREELVEYDNLNIQSEEEQDELEEASMTGNLDGGEGPPKTPHAFQSKKKRAQDKKKEDEISTNSTGFTKVNEGRFYAFYNNKKYKIDGKDAYDAKLQAIKKLKVPKSKVGMLSIVNAKEHDRGGFRFEQKLRQTIREIIKEQLNEAYRSQSIFFDKKDKSKLEKLLKKNKGKFPFNPSGESVVNWSITNQGSKGLEWRGIPKSKYDKAVEFFMKNKLNPRG